MDEPKIAQKKPFIMDMAPGTHFWCACGKSQNQPFCDGSHKGSAFSPVKHTFEEAAKVAWCGCKHTKTPPFCDGTHRNI